VFKNSAAQLDNGDRMGCERDLLRPLVEMSHAAPRAAWRMCHDGDSAPVAHRVSFGVVPLANELRIRPERVYVQRGDTIA
jgi:hypothetical protein